MRLMSVASTGKASDLISDPCQWAAKQDSGFKLAARGIIGRYSVYGPAQHTKEFTAWLGKHSNGGGKGNPDHFLLGHLRPTNNDQPKIQIVQSVANGSLRA